MIQSRLTCRACDAKWLRFTPRPLAVIPPCPYCGEREVSAHATHATEARTTRS